MDNCKIVSDLLPTYCDELTSLETNAVIRVHLDNCPGCSRLLERMQKDRVQKKEADLRRSEFKVAMATYERTHRTRVQIILFACLLLIAVFFVFRAFSFDMAIAFSGLNGDYVEVVQEPTKDADGREFQIVATRTKEEEVALAWLTKNTLGFWSVDAVEVATVDQHYGVAQMIWTEFVHSFYDGELSTSFVVHRYYAGSNATGSFEQLPYEQIPGNVTVIPTQRYGNYYMHVITVLPDGGNSYDILPLLKESNLIA